MRPRVVNIPEKLIIASVWPWKQRRLDGIHNLENERLKTAMFYIIFELHGNVSVTNTKREMMHS